MYLCSHTRTFRPVLEKTTGELLGQALVQASNDLKQLMNPGQGSGGNSRQDVQTIRAHFGRLRDLVSRHTLPLGYQIEEGLVRWVSAPFTFVRLYNIHFIPLPLASINVSYISACVYVDVCIP